MDQQRLFTLAVEAVALTAVHDGAAGWRLMITLRRQGESWADVERVDYSHMTTQELLDVVCVELENRL